MSLPANWREIADEIRAVRNPGTPEAELAVLALTERYGKDALLAVAGRLALDLIARDTH